MLSSLYSVNLDISPFSLSRLLFFSTYSPDTSPFFYFICSSSGINLSILSCPQINTPHHRSTSFHPPHPSKCWDHSRHFDLYCQILYYMRRAASPSIFLLSVQPPSFDNVQRSNLPHLGPPCGEPSTSWVHRRHILQAEQPIQNPGSKSAIQPASAVNQHAGPLWFSHPGVRLRWQSQLPSRQPI